ncbi:MAG: hypothetical protein OXC05_02425 [Halieaceae bacterium]|nr:hypothetical protein [Halieaceae bacterium]
MSAEKKILSKEPWWEEPPQPGQTEADLRWGYLVFYEDRSFAFLDERPSDEELQGRSSCFIPTLEETGMEQAAPPEQKRNGLRQKEAGFSLIQMVMAIGLMSFMTIQLIPYVTAWQEAQLIRVTRLGIEQIAQASVAFRADQHDHFTVATWPADLQRLVTDGYLPGPVTRYMNSVGEPYNLNTPTPPDRWLEISTEMLTTQQALKVAADWGAFSSVNGAVITVNIAVPGQESSHSELVQLDGSHDGLQQEMRGPLHWDTALMELDAMGNTVPTRDAISLGDNDLDQVRQLNVRERLRVQDGGAGLLEADAANVQALTATELRYD